MKISRFFGGALFAAVSAVAMAQNGVVAEVSPADATDYVARSKGTLVVMLSSLQTSCTYCIRANPVFEQLAKGTSADQPQFIRVMYRPWNSITNDTFAQANKVGGLPIFLTFKDGKPVRNHLGVADVPTLQKNLLEGLN